MITIDIDKIAWPTIRLPLASTGVAACRSIYIYIYIGKQIDLYPCARERERSRHLRNFFCLPLLWCEGYGEKKEGVVASLKRAFLASCSTKRGMGKRDEGQLVVGPAEIKQLQPPD